MCIKSLKKLAITTWNVNGLSKRISGDRICKLDDKIIDHVMNNDIVTFSETHIPAKEILMYDGYKCFVNCRHSESKRARGGLATFVKKEILSGVKLIDTSTNDLMWFRTKCIFMCFF